MRNCVFVLVLLILIPLLGALPAYTTEDRPVRIIIGIKNTFNYDQSRRNLAALGKVSLEIPELNVIVLEVSDKITSSIVKLSFVKYVEKDELIEALGEVQWNIEMVNATDAWSEYSLIYSSAAYGGGVQVAVVDTGIDYAHKDLQGAVTYCIVSLRNSKTYYEGTNMKNCADPNGHGTHVAGIIAARLNNIGVAGVAPKTNLYAVRVLDASGSGYISDVAKGIIEAVKGIDDIAGTDDDADVISMSLGGPHSQALYEAIKYAYNNGAVLVAATGNEGASSPSYPAAYSEVIAVGAVDSNYTIASWSNRNPSVVAPGVNVLSTWPRNKYAYASGTSMACPHVSGAVALVQALRIASGKPKLTPDQMMSLVKSTAVDLGRPGYDEEYGYGLIDAYNMVQKALSA